MTARRDRHLAERHMLEVIQRLAGDDATPRGDQLDAVEAIIQPQARVLVVQATGWGKSAVYWAATSALRSLGLGPTLVVSPLLALMRNQVDAAARAGLTAATINSANHDEWDRVFAALRGDQLDVLLISPERLGNERFASQLDSLMEKVGLVVIDEAHCISDWGFDFRPDYQRLARTLLSTPSASVLATTATANQRVTKDVGDQMGKSTTVFRGTLARTSLSLSVVPGLTPLERFAWVAHALHDLPGSGIVYVLTVAEANRLADYLGQAGFNCAAYTGQLSSDERSRVETALLNNDMKAVVATSALGMGYDKPDLGFVVHVGSPSTPVAYYQQVGRAGRGLDHAIAVLLPAEADERIWDFFATASIPEPKDVALVLEQLGEATKSVVALESSTGIRRGRLEALLKILAVEGVTRKVPGGWSATGKRYVHDSEKWAALKKSRAAEADLMRNYAGGRGCLMEFLQRSLDDPNPAPCGKCSVCTGIAPGPGARPDKKWLSLAAEFSRGIDILIEKRQRWPSGTEHANPIMGIREGRAVAFADDPGWLEQIQEMRDSGFRSIPQELLDGSIEVLKRWSKIWPERPTWVMPAPAHGALADANRAVAQHIAAIGKRPLVELFEWNVGPTPENAPSKPIVDHLDRAIKWKIGVEVPDGPVLLCSAQIRTRWTSTVVARLLHEMGKGPVLPFALHQMP